MSRRMTGKHTSAVGRRLQAQWPSTAAKVDGEGNGRELR